MDATPSVAAPRTAELDGTGSPASRASRSPLPGSPAGARSAEVVHPDGGPAEHSETLQMYLRAVHELHEAGVAPRRARLVERLKVSAPAVSETVNRLAAQGYLTLDDDRVLHLTERGQLIASDVVRRHQVAYRFLHDVLNLDAVTADDEACAWEHVLSPQVEHAMQAWLSTQA